MQCSFDIRSRSNIKFACFEMSQTQYLEEKKDLVSKGGTVVCQKMTLIHEALPIFLNMSLF